MLLVVTNRSHFNWGKTHPLQMGGNLNKFGGVENIEIRIVGSIGDKDDIATIKRITEIFLIETRIRGILEKDTKEKNISEKSTPGNSSPPPLHAKVPKTNI